MTGFVYCFGIHNASEAKIEVFAFDAFISWTVNGLYVPGEDKLLVALVSFSTNNPPKVQKRTEKR